MKKPKFALDERQGFVVELCLTALVNQSKSPVELMTMLDVLAGNAIHIAWGDGEHDLDEACVAHGRHCALLCEVIDRIKEAERDDDA
jgi:hypothetical protein